MNQRDLGSAAVAAVAILLGSLALTPVFSSAAWLPPVAAAVVVVLAGGLLLRAGGSTVWAGLTRNGPVPRAIRGLGVAAVPVGQLLLLGCLLTALYAPDRALGGVLPTRDSTRQLVGVLADGMAEMREQATPALALTGLLALTTLFVGLVAVAADLLAVAGRVPALAGVGVLVLACVPVMTTSGGIGLVALAAPAIGFVLLLWADQHRRLPARGRSSGALLRTGVVAAARTGVAALLAGIVIGALVPILREGSLATGLGGGTGSSTGTALDPVAQLQGQLTLSESIPLLRIETSVDDPGYLRAVTLDGYDAESGWSTSNLDGETSIADENRLAPLPLEQIGRPVSAEIQVLDHDDRFLPVPSSPLSVRLRDADPDSWRFDPATGTVFGRNITTTELTTYRVSAVEPRPSPALLAAAGPLLPFDDVQERFTALPTLPAEVTDLVTSLTAGAGGPYERVRRIHDYLTDRSNGFIYSLSTEPGTSGDDLVDFLRLKRGYCEQYAAAMAVMVRAADVPARFAMGYTPGSEERNGTRLITSDDAHAWVEVYFDELGWVPFDPTPIAAGRAVDLDWAPRGGAEDSADESAGALTTAAPTTAAAPRTDRAGEAVPGASADRQGTDVLLPVLAGAGIVLLAAAVLGAPALVRALQRRRRVAEGTAGALWDELTATALDLGVRLAPTRTPRQTAGELVTLLSRSGGGAAAVEAVQRLVREEEAASYGREGRSPGRVAHPDAAPALRTVRRAMERSVSRRSRLLARWWPTSLVAGAGAQLSERGRARLAALTPPRRTGRTGTV